MTSKPLRAISFDAADTLIYLPRGVGDPYAQVAGRHGIHVPPDRWESAFRAAWKVMRDPEPTVDGGPFPDDQRAWWAELVHHAVNGLELDLEQSAEDALFADLWDHFAEPGVWQVYPEVHEVLAAIRSKHLILAVISNFDKRLYPVLEYAGLTPYFEEIYLSSEHGADKPHPRMFQRFLKACDLSGMPDRALHVGDHPKADWAAAKAVGMRFLELKRDEGGTLRDLLALL